MTEARQATRYPVSYRAPGEHRQLGEIHLQIVNVSRSGFLVLESMGIARGDRVMMALPKAGHIEAFCLWTRDQQAGFQFERLIRAEDFALMLVAMNSG